MQNTKTMQKPNIQSLGIAVALLALSGGVASAQFFVLHSFTGGADGASPYYGAPVVSGPTFYGTANGGGADGGGVVFSVNTDGTGYNELHTFTYNAPDGDWPLASVVLNGSTLYGTSYGGGDSGNGTLFSVNTDGSGYQTLDSFEMTAGFNPFGPVTLSGTNLYGMTWTSDGYGGFGSIYSVNTNGKNYTTLHDFAGGASDGASPVGGALTLSGSTLYGTTANGGSTTIVDEYGDEGYGVVFAINTNGSGYTDLVSFNGAPDGAFPYGSLTLVGTTLYGTTVSGGTSNLGTIFSVNTDGTGYSMLFSFTNSTANGANPNGSLTVAGSILLGTTENGGSANDGTVFKINLDGTGFGVLHNFTGADGANPQGDLALTTNGSLYTLYGWTPNGGANGYGTLFSLEVGGYAFGGLGITNVLTGSVANGGLFWGTVPTWINAWPIPMPYTNAVSFVLPPCDRVVASRLVMTIWGGEPAYTCQMTVTVNGTNLPAANPFVFGTTTDMNAVFEADAPCAYGSGYGTWLVTLPVPGGMLLASTNGSTNTVSIIEATPDNFDGRMIHVSLAAVYQSSALTNEFDYALAEGSGDIYGAPNPVEVNQRTVVFGAVNPSNAIAATLTALYTYAGAGQNNELFFNGTQLGSDDVAQWNTSVADYGPSVVSFDVLAGLEATNTAQFTVATGELRPQFAALAVTKPLTAGQLAISGVDAAGAHLLWNGPLGGSYAIETTTNLTLPTWNVLTNFVSTAGAMSFTDPAAANGISRFYRAKAQ
jgi:uncharacterized repeat protein (TIGR03803 family)